MKTSFYTFFEQTILDNIDFEGYGIKNDGYLYDKIKTLYNIFKREYIHENNKHLNEVYLFASWLQGLPSVLTVPFNNSEILENALLNGFDVSTEDKEYLFLNEYWNNLAKAFFTLKENL
jgi:hypothetical protein